MIEMTGAQSPTVRTRDERGGSPGGTFGALLVSDFKIGEECLVTLLAYYDSPGTQARQAARALGLREKTVTYRLSQVRELTGCDKDCDRFRLEIAVRVWDHLRHGASQDGDPEWLKSMSLSPGNNA